MVHRVEMPRAERLGTDEERRRRLSADCSLEKVADEVDLSCDGCCTIYKERRKAFYKASRADLYRMVAKPMRWEQCSSIYDKTIDCMPKRQ